jgi:plasmid stability protein
MATLIVRNVPDEVRDELKLRAARRGVSMEEEVRGVLERAVNDEDEDEAAMPGSGAALFARLQAIADELGGVELEEFPDEPFDPPPLFEDET